MTQGYGFPFFSGGELSQEEPVLESCRSDLRAAITPRLVLVQRDSTCVGISFRKEEKKNILQDINLLKCTPFLIPRLKTPGFACPSSPANGGCLSLRLHGALGLVLFIKVLMGTGNRNFHELMKLRLCH